MTAFSGRIRAAVIVAIALTSVGCTETIDIQTDSAYGPGIKLTGLGDSYAWAPTTRQRTAQTPIDNPEVRAFIVSSIDSEMSKRGFSRVTEGRPDFWMLYHVTRVLEDDWDATPFGTPYPEGTLVLEVVDPSSRQLIWRGTARARIDPSSPPEAREKRISAAVGMLMSQFPPRLAKGDRG